MLPGGFAVNALAERLLEIFSGPRAINQHYTCNDCWIYNFVSIDDLIFRATLNLSCPNPGEPTPPEA
jgi:hypothetical protein